MKYSGAELPAEPMARGNARALPGFKKKSFALPFGGGEIWFEHLDGMYTNDDLALEKLSGDRPTFSRPSMPSLLCFVMDETEITPAIVAAVADALTNTRKAFRRVCFVGADRQTEKALRSALRSGPFALAFMDDLEKAKEWLVRAER